MYQIRCREWLNLTALQNKMTNFICRYAVPETPFSVPVKLGSKELNELISSLLSSNGKYASRLMVTVDLQGPILSNIVFCTLI